MIREPQRTYILELAEALGPVVSTFVVAGAQAMKFMLGNARTTKDFDFVLDVISLRGEKLLLDATLKELGYEAVEGAQNFQFQKPIPDSSEIMRIEFMAPEEFKREKDFRVEVQRGVHARACTGGSIAILESETWSLSGKLPNGSPFTAAIRVIKSHALVMLKLLALDDRYRNIRGLREAGHDREEARVHAADIVAILSAQTNLAQFKKDFDQQFNSEAILYARVRGILGDYFRETTSPGLLVYEEFIGADIPAGRESRIAVGREVARAHEIFRRLLPPEQ